MWGWEASLGDPTRQKNWCRGLLGSRAEVAAGHTESQETDDLGAPTSEEAAVLEVLLDDDVCDSVEDKLHVLCVGGTRHMGVNLLHIAAHVELEKLNLDVVARILVRVGAWRERGVLLSLSKGPPQLRPEGRKGPASTRRRRHLAAEPGKARQGWAGRALTVVVGKADTEMRLLDLLGENILLVEEEHDGRGGEVAVVADAVEQV